MKAFIQTENAPTPVGPYSQAVKAGNFLFVSGQIAIDPHEGKIVSTNIKDQTERVLENLRSILQAAGFSIKDVVQATVYLSSLADFKEFNAAYGKYFDKPFPARATVGAELVPNALVEVSVVAYKE
jgi:2-iminobutanoate/2-iminopropanoate deaminase